MCGFGGCLGELGKRDMFSAVIICITDFFKQSFCPVCLFNINLNPFDVDKTCTHTQTILYAAI